MSDLAADAPRHPAPGPDRVDVVRHEERLHVTTERVPVRVARLQRYIVTEQRTFTVEVRHEEARLVYDDLPADASGRIPEPTGDTPMPEVVLSEEQVEFRTVTRAVARARLVLDAVTEQRTLSDTVRVEQVRLEQRPAAVLDS